MHTKNVPQKALLYVIALFFVSIVGGCSFNSEVVSPPWKLPPGVSQQVEGKRVVTLLFNPFCAPSRVFVSEFLGPLKELLTEDPRINFQVIPVILSGSSAPSIRALAELRCQTKFKPGLLAIAELMAEVNQSIVENKGDSYDYSWNHRKSAERCGDLREFEDEVRMLSERVKSGDDWPGTPSLFIEGKEIPLSTVEDIKEVILAWADYKGVE